MGQLLKRRYQLLHELGRGAFAVTWLAEDRATGRLCVAKILSLLRADSPKAHELFEREAQVLAHLDHPRIPKFLDSFSEATADDEQVVLVQEHVAGRDLARLVRDGQRLDEARAIGIGVGLAEILEHLHEFAPPILHRDVKPSNVVIAEDGAAWLVDFGAVRDKVLHDPLLVPGGPTVVGTFGYMPPEQFQGEALPASDVYSLAATLVHALSGLEPWELDKVAMRPVLRPRVPASEALLEVLERALEPDHRRRTTTARQFREALLRAAATPRRQPLARRTAAAGAVVVGGCVAAALWWTLASPVTPLAPLRTPSQATARVERSIGPAAPAAPLRLGPSVAWPRANHDAAGDPLPPGAVQRLGTVRLRHGGPVRAVSFGVDGGLVWSAGEDDSVVGWDAATGAQRRRFETHMPVVAIALSADGRRLAASLGDSSVRVFEIGSGRELARLLVPPEPSGGHRLPLLAFDPGDAARLVTFSDRGTLDVWRVLPEGGGGHLHRLALCDGSPRGLAYADGARPALQAVCGDRFLVIDASSGRIESQSAAGRMGDRLFRTRDGRWWATSNGPTVRRLDATTGTAEIELPQLPASATSLALTPDGDTLLAGLANGSTMAFDAATGRRQQVYEGHAGAVTALAASSDGRFVATGGEDHTLRILDRRTGQSSVPEQPGHRHAVEALAFSASGGALYSGGADAALIEWAVDGRARAVRELSGAVMLLAPMGPTRLLVGERNGHQPAPGHEQLARLRLFEGASAIREFPVPSQALGVAFSATTGLVASASGTSIHRFDLAQDRPASWSTPLREQPVAFSPDGRILATLRHEGDYARALVLRDSGSGRELQRYAGHESGPGSLACRGADGSFLIHGGSLMRLGPGPQGSLQYAGVTGGAVLCAVSPDAQRIALGDRDRLQLREVRHDDSRRGWEMWRLAWLAGHRGRVSAVAFSPDARWLATGGFDSQVLVWDLEAIRSAIAGRPAYLPPSWPPPAVVPPSQQAVLEVSFDARPRGVAPFHRVAEAAARSFVPASQGLALDTRQPVTFPEGASIALGDAWSFEATLTFPALPLPPYLGLVRSDAVHLDIQGGGVRLVLGFLNQGGHSSVDLAPWTGPLVAGRPYHVAVTYDRASGAVQVCVDAACAQQPRDLTLADRIGELVLGDRDPRHGAYALVDEVRFHSRALTDAEIARGAGQPRVRARDAEPRP